MERLLYDVFEEMTGFFKPCVHITPQYSSLHCEDQQSQALANSLIQRHGEWRGNWDALKRYVTYLIKSLKVNRNDMLSC